MAHEREVANALDIPAFSDLLPSALFPRPTILQHRLQFLDEILYVFELAVDAGKTDEGDLVELAQMAHDGLAEILRGHFAVEVRVDVTFDGADDPFDLIFADGALPAGFFQTALDLVAFEGDTRAVFLHDAQRGLFD